MKVLGILLSVTVITILIGCSRVYFPQGKTTQDYYADKFECGRKALASGARPGTGSTMEDDCLQAQKDM
jgi:hypothetical protein